MTTLPHLPARRAHFTSTATILAVLALGVSPAAALADGELVNRADGPTGEPFSGELLGVSEDGQSVLLTGPAELAGLTDAYTTAFVRNRKTKTLRPVLREDGPSGTLHSADDNDFASWDALSISPDGKRVLIRASSNGGSTASLVVRDLETGRTTTVSTLPNGSTGLSRFGVFVDGGNSVIYGTVDELDEHPAVYRRTVVGGTAQLLKSGVTLTSATRDGSTFTWTRELPAPVRPPETDPQLQFIPYKAVGYTTVGGASRVVERASLLVRTRQGPGCGYPSNVLTGPRSIQIDASGRHLWWSRWTVTSPTPEPYVSYHSRSTEAANAPTGGLPFGGTGYTVASIEDLSATGDFALVHQPNRNAPLSTFGPITGLGGTPWTPPSRGATPAPTRTYNGRLFAQDRGYVAQELGAAGSEILAFDPTAAVPTPPAVVAPKANASDLPDDPALKPTVKVEPVPCGEVTKAPVGVTLAAPVTTAKPAGTVTVGIGGVVPKVTIVVKTLGFTTWSKTLSSYVGQSISLPRPWWYLPQTVTVTASYPAAGDSPASTTTTTRGWTALR